MTANALSASQRAQYRRAIVENGGSTNGLTDEQIIARYQELGLQNAAPAIETSAQISQFEPPAPEPKWIENPVIESPRKSGKETLAAQIVELISSHGEGGISEARVKQLIQEYAFVTHTVHIEQVNIETVSIEGAHPALPDVMRAVKIGGALNVGWPFLVGPAGSGKTTLAGQVAEGLGLPFYAKESVQDKFELIGFVDANGNYQATDFYRAFKEGGVFLFDEKDRSAPEAVVAFNMALANGRFSFPNGETVKRHKDCYFIAAGNTFGDGASRTYSTAQVLDGATMDRYTRVAVDYDKAIEHSAAMSAALAFNSNVSIDDVGAVVGIVQKARQFARDNDIDAIFSPRQSMVGACLIAQGVNLVEVRQTILEAKLTEQQIQQIGYA